MIHSRSFKRPHRLLIVTLASTLSAAAVSGCSFVEKKTADIYSITYRVKLEGRHVDAISGLSYGEAPSRGEDTSPVHKGDIDLPSVPENTQKASWEGIAVVGATRPAWITATPLADTTATCTILIDGTKEISTETGKAGEQVRCEATTPAFPKKK